MAAEEVIVTKFTGDLTDLEGSVADYQKTLDKAAGASGNLDKSTKNLGASTGDLVAKMKVAASEGSRVAQSTAQIATAAAKGDSPLRRLGNTIANFGRGARDGFRSAIKEVGGFRGALGQLSANARGAFATLGNSFKSLSGSIGQVGSQIPIVGGLASALGPVGIAASAVAGGILAIAKNTDAGATALDGYSRAAGLAFDRITGIATELADRFTDTSTASGSFFNALVEGSKRAVQALIPAVALVKDLFDSDIAAGQDLAQRFDELQDLQSQVNLATAQNEVPLRKNLALLRDTTKPVEERLRIADEITRIETENLALRTKALRTELDIVGAQIAQQVARKGEADDALRFRFNELRANLASAEADSVSITERVAVRRAQITEQEEARKKAARDKALEEHKKREAEALRISQERGRAEEAIAKLVADAEFTVAQSGRSESEQELAVIRQKYSAIEAETAKHFDKLRELTAANGQSELAAKEAQALIAIDKAKNAEIEASTKARNDKEKELRDERLKLVRDATKSEVQIEIDGINKRFDELEKYARTYIEDEQELTAILVELAKARGQAVYDAEKIGLDKTAQLRKQALDQSVDLFRQSLETIQQFINASFDRRIQATESREAQIQAAIEKAVSNEEKTRLEAELKATQQQKVELEKRKKQQQAFAIAATLIQTYQAAQAAYASQLIPGDPTSPIRAALAAALAVAAGLLNVANIKAVQGAYEGEEYVDGKPMFSGKDGHLRRLHTGERVVTAKTNKEHWSALDAMHKGRFDDWIDRTYLAPMIASLAYRDDARVAEFNDSDTGQRIAQSVMLAKFYDANIVGELKANRRESKVQTEVLATIARNLRPASRRAW